MKHILSYQNYSKASKYWHDYDDRNLTMNRCYGDNFGFYVLEFGMNDVKIEIIDKDKFSLFVLSYI